MNITIVGAGALGHYFADRLIQGQCEIDFIFSKSETSALGLSKQYGGQGLSLSEASSRELTLSSDVLLLTVPDDVITKVAQDLASSFSLVSSPLVVHCSGSQDISVLSALDSKVGMMVSIHPLKSIVRNHKEDISNKLVCGVECLEDEREELQPFLNMLNIDPIWLSAKSKGAYHLAASILSNYTVTLHSFAAQLIEIVKGQGSNIELHHFEDLLDGTLSNIRETSPVESLTGPIARGEVGTVTKHLELLENLGDQNALRVYKTLGLLTLELSQENSPKTIDRKDELTRLLELPKELGNQR